MTAVQQRLAVFGGHTVGVFKKLVKNFREYAQVTTPFLELCGDALKNCYPDLYGDDPQMRQFDLMQALEEDRVEVAEDASMSWPLLTIGHLTSYMVHMHEERKGFGEGAKEWAAASGDRQGLLSAVTIAASSSEEEFRKNTVNAIKAALIAGASGTPSELAANWGRQGVAFTKLRVPVKVGGSDLPDGPEMANQLADILKSQDDVLPTRVRAPGGVVEFGCPQDPYGQRSLIIDTMRDIDAVKQALPDVAEIKREVLQRGFKWGVSLPVSFFWLFHDTALAAGCFYAFYALMQLEVVANSSLLTWLGVWPVYSVVMGTVLTGLWVIGHECGHTAFAGRGQFSWINDVVGFVVHSALLVPFYSWRFSHHKHHNFTNHLLDGETHVPNHRNGATLDYNIWKVVGEDAFVVVNAFIHLVLGWPLYLIRNATGGRRSPDGKRLDRNGPKSHFFPSSQIFEEWQRPYIIPSSIGVLATIAATIYADVEYGMGTSLFWYWGAYVVVNFWLVLYTWLHHTDVHIPHFSDGHFTYMRGATCSIDRNYPALINYLHHDIGATHVLHHISFQLPHYRARDATEVFKSRWPHLYRYDTRPIYKVLAEVSRTCHYVEGVDGIQFYQPLTKLHAEKKAEKKGKAKTE